MRDHRKLTAFQLADSLVIAVYRETSGFPRAEQFGLVSQMRRAAVSVAANIVEGCARASQREFVRFLDHSFGSLRELGYFIELSEKLGYLPSRKVQGLDTTQGRTAAAVAALIKALR